MSVRLNWARAEYVRLVWIVLLLENFITMAPAFGDQRLPSFTAICDDKNTHGFRTGTNLQGQMLPDHWATDEYFFGDHFETFTFKQGDNFVTLEKRRKRAPIIGAHSGGIVILDATSGANEASVWTYAVNLKIKRIVASEVSSSEFLGTGLKGRVVDLDCKFNP